VTDTGWQLGRERYEPATAAIDALLPEGASGIAEEESHE
jgi:hypothetical protein